MTGPPISCAFLEMSLMADEAFSCAVARAAEVDEK
jgi:hypothetical protein